MKKFISSQLNSVAMNAKENQLIYFFLLWIYWENIQEMCHRFLKTEEERRKRNDSRERK